MPQTSQVTMIESQICSNSKTAAQALKAALQAGGSQAEAWVYALFNAVSMVCMSALLRPRGCAGAKCSGCPATTHILPAMPWQWGVATALHRCTSSDGPHFTHHMPRTAPLMPVTPTRSA